MFFTYRALDKDRIVVLGNHQIGIAMADSWHQPLPIYGGGSGHSLSPLELLNDDCLLQIYDYLEPSDVVNLSLTSDRLEDFAAKHIYKKYRNFEMLNTDGRITLVTFRSMLSRFGDIIETINLSEYAFNKENIWRYLQFVLKLCKNLTTLRISYFSLQPQHLAKLCVQSDTLTSLELKSCQGFTDNWSRMLKCWPNLHSVTISENNQISGGMLFPCTRLESLTLISCDEIEEHPLRKIFQNNALTLRNLELNKCLTLEGCTVVPVIVRCLPRLESVSLQFNYMAVPLNLNCLAELEHLRRIQIACNLFSICSLLDSLGDKGQLEDLDIIGGCLDADTCKVFKKFTRMHTLRICQPYSETEMMLETIAAQLPNLRSFSSQCCNSLTDSSVVDMFRSCPKIERLDIAASASVTFEAVRQIIEIIKANEVAANEDNTDDNRCRRPHLKFNLDTFFDVTDDQKTFLSLNQHLITFTQITRPLEEPYYDDDSFNDLDDMDDTDDDDFDDLLHPYYSDDYDDDDGLDDDLFY